MNKIITRPEINSIILLDKLNEQLAKIETIDDVKNIIDKAEALRIIAKQIGKKLELQNRCAEIKIKAQREGGRRLREMAERGERRTAEDGKSKVFLEETPKSLPDLGISKKQAHVWQVIERLPKEDFDDFIIATKNELKELTSAGIFRLSQKLHNPTKLKSLPEDKYRIIYADPPWRYENFVPDYFHEQADHYQLMTIKEICEMPVKEITQENAVLFLWVTSPILEESFKVVNAWGFKYKSSFIWDKVKHNLGHYNSVRHEFLLIAIKGSCQPDVKKLFDSVQTIERSKEHSRKPEKFREIIDILYPNGKRIELFPRGIIPKNWEGWGDEFTRIS